MVNRDIRTPFINRSLIIPIILLSGFGHAKYTSDALLTERAERAPMTGERGSAV